MTPHIIVETLHEKLISCLIVSIPFQPCYIPAGQKSKLSKPRQLVFG